MGTDRIIMLETTIENKRYTLKRINYDANVAPGVISIEVLIEEDIPFGVNSYIYGIEIRTEDEILFFESNISAMKDYVVARLVELKA